MARKRSGLIRVLGSIYAFFLIFRAIYNNYKTPHQIPQLYITLQVRFMFDVEKSLKEKRIFGSFMLF